MIRIVLRSDYKEKHPPSKCFTVMNAEKRTMNFSGLDTEVTNIEVSVEQLQEILRGLWKLLPPVERPCP